VYVELVSEGCAFGMLGYMFWVLGTDVRGLT